MFYYRFLRRNTLTPDDVITFVLNKMRRNLIKIRSCAFFRWFNWLYRFVLICRSVNVLVFDWLIRKYETFSLVNSWCLRNNVKLACGLKSLSRNVITKVLDYFVPLSLS